MDLTWWAIGVPLCVGIVCAAWGFRIFMDHLDDNDW
jgi:hypothetical protein